MMRFYQKIIEHFDLCALGIVGSRARGDFSEYSDLDLVGFSKQCSFHRFKEEGLVVELHISDDLEYWEKRPSWWYALEEIQTIQDNGTIEALKANLSRWRSQYRPSVVEVQRNRDWLEAVVRKLSSQRSPVESLFIVTTSTWEILSGVFISAGQPVPASSDMLRLAPKLMGQARFQALFLQNPEQRRVEALSLCREIIAKHNAFLSPEP